MHSPGSDQPRDASLRNGDIDIDQEVSAWVLSTGYQAVSPRCSLFARKFPAAPAASSRASGIKGRLFSKAGRAGLHWGKLTPPRHDPLLEWALSCSVGLAMGSHCDNYTHSASLDLA